MAFKDWIIKVKSFFKSDNSNKENIDRIVELANAEKPAETTIPEQPSEKSLEENNEQITENLNHENTEMISETDVTEPEISSGEQIGTNPKTQEEIAEDELKESATTINDINLKKLEIIKIEREAETIASYSKMLLKDMVLYKDEKSDNRAGNILKKYKMIFIHSMELKNLLSSADDYFYSDLLANQTNKDKAGKELEIARNKVVDLIGLLAKLGLYDELLNAEKSENYKDNLNSEVEKGEFARLLEETSRKLTENINRKGTGIADTVNSLANKLRN